MSQYEQKLSAYLDGELPIDEARALESALAEDPSLQAELEALIAVDSSVQDAFEHMLKSPVPIDLAQSISNASIQPAANATRPPTAFGWLTALAVAVALCVGGSVGYLREVSQSPQIASTTPIWIADIASYHAVYAEQKRHLVEVGPDQADHIETWLSATIGAQVTIPDLQENGLTFAGGRLLVAAGKPVAQLMYLDADARVVALCLIQSDTPKTTVRTQTIDAFDIVTWGGEDANFVLIGDQGRTDLTDIAKSAAEQV